MRLSLKKLLLKFVTAFVIGFFQHLAMMSFVGFYLHDLVQTPRLIGLIAGPLSIFGLWLVLYRPRELVRWLRHSN